MVFWWRSKVNVLDNHKQLSAEQSGVVNVRLFKTLCKSLELTIIALYFAAKIGNTLVAAIFWNIQTYEIQHK